MTALKVERNGDQLTIQAPADVMKALGAAFSGNVYLHELGHGDFILSSAKTEAELQYEIGLGVMRDFPRDFRRAGEMIEPKRLDLPTVIRLHAVASALILSSPAPAAA